MARQAPGFVADGIRSLTMRCESARSHCSLLLLGTEGRSLLSCPLSPSTASWRRLLGGPWQAIAASSSVGAEEVEGNSPRST